MEGAIPHELPADWDMVSRKAVVTICQERAEEMIALILDGEPSHARLRESMEAAIRRIEYAVAFMPSASGDTVISVGTDGAAEAAEAAQ